MKTKVIFINPEEQAVIEIELPDLNLKTFYNLMDCDLITCVQINDTDDIVVDDEGLLKDNYHYLFNNGRLCGKSIIVSTDDEGDWQSPNITVEEVTKHIKWLGYIKDGEFNIPPPTIIGFKEGDDFLEALNNLPENPCYIKKEDK